MSPPNQSPPASIPSGVTNNESKKTMGDQMFFGAKTDPATKFLTQEMEVTEVGVYRGPHYYSHTPMIRIQLDLGRLEEFPTSRIPGFTDALLDMLPGVGRHGCSLRVRGGFEKRLRDGTWLGHAPDARRVARDARQDPLGQEPAGRLQRDVRLQ
jgi:hypothetical protein